MIRTILMFFLIICATTGFAASTERRIVDNKTLQGVPGIPAELISRASQYSNIRSASNASWSPDGNSILVSTRFAATRQLHLVSNPMSNRKQLTFFDEPVGSASFSPTSDQILYSRDSGGDENHQAFLLDIDSGVTRQLTTPGSRNSGLRWSNDGKQFAYMSNREDPARFDVWVSPIDDPSKARKVITGTGYYWVPITWSRDNQKLLVKQVVSAVDSRPFVFDLSSNKLTRIGSPDKT